MKKILIPALLLLALSLPMAAQSLYGTGISPKSALVRVIFTEAVGALELEIGSETFSSSDRDTSRTYHPLSPGMYFFELGDEWVEVIPMSGKYYTIIIHENKSFIFEDVEHKAPAKSQVYFYNTLENETASLLVSGSGEKLFDNVPSGESAQRAINPLDIDFDVATDKERELSIGSLPMSRGGSTTVLLYETQGQLQTLIFEASVRKES